jgi:cytochrome P450
VRPFPGSRISNKFALSRDILRSPRSRQANASSAITDVSDADETPFPFLDGEPHKKRRASVASFFTPKAISQRYVPLMETTMDRVLTDFQKRGSGTVDMMSLELASVVTMDILGLTDSDVVAMTRRVQAILNNRNAFDRRVHIVLIRDYLFRWFFNARMALRKHRFWRADIVPAIEARRKAPRDDVLTYLIDRNYSKNGITMECMTYATAGVSTTREFIVMALWQLFDHPDLLQRFRDDDEEAQFAILHEIVRLDPPAGYLYRRSPADGAAVTDHAGELVAIDLRANNSDPDTVGECPFQIDPDRARRQKNVGAYMSFGDGPHRCPGSQLALVETRVFLNRILQVPGLSLVQAPTVSWNLASGTYELRGCLVTCDRA